MGGAAFGLEAREEMVREQSIQNAILLAVQERYPLGLFYRRNVGAVKTDHGFVKFGMAGQADIAGILNGFAIEIEVKADRGKQSEAQANWQRAVERAGGVYILARSVEDVLDQLRSMQHIITFA